MPSGAAELAARLRGPVPPSVAALDEAVQAELAAAIAEAHRDQVEGLQRSRDDALRHIPWPLRKVAQRVLGA